MALIGQVYVPRGRYCRANALESGCRGNSGKVAVGKQS